MDYFQTSDYPTTSAAKIKNCIEIRKLLLDGFEGIVDMITYSESALYEGWCVSTNHSYLEMFWRRQGHVGFVLNDGFQLCELDFYIQNMRSK